MGAAWVPAAGGGMDTELTLSAPLAFTHLAVTEAHNCPYLPVSPCISLYLAFTHLAVTEAHNRHTNPSHNPNPNP